MNEAAGLIICFLTQLKTILGLHKRRLSVPEVHELIAQSWYPCRGSCLDRITPVVYTPHLIYKESKKAHCAQALVMRAVCSSAPLSGAAPFLQTCQLG
jgi:hypothetical protein